MEVLVAYASRHGATAGIADRLAERIREGGMTADCVEVGDVKDPGRYDAYVIGSAAYMFHWLKEASSFVERNREILADRPVWLFSSGPLGTDLVDEEGNDVLEASRPKEFEELEAVIRPVDEHVFFGAWDPDAPPKGMAERMFRMMPVSKEVLPAGDFRDWDAIDTWADEIVAALRGSITPKPTPSSTT